MQRIHSIVVTSLFAILGTASPLVATAAAQYDPGITVDIPFAFSADGQQIAAGTYELQPISSNFLMSLRNVSTGNEQFIPVRPEEHQNVEVQGRLIFQVCDGQSYLKEIHIPGTNLISETTNGRRQGTAELEACSNGNATTVALR